MKIIKKSKIFLLLFCVSKVVQSVNLIWPNEYVELLFVSGRLFLVYIL